MQTPTTVGKLQLVRYENQQEKVKVVLVGGASAPDANSLRDQLNQIYGPSQTTWSVETDTYSATDWDTDKNGLNAGDNATLSQYTAEMNALKRGYFQQHSQGSNTYYVFVVAGFSPATVQGYMPRGRGGGFISSGGDVAHTRAHELGHGAFGLEHTFDEVPQGSTATAARRQPDGLWVGQQADPLAMGADSAPGYEHQPIDCCFNIHRLSTDKQG